MVYLLSMLLSMLAIANFSYLFSKNNVSSPTFLSSVLFCIVILFSIFNYQTWGVSYSTKTVFIIIIAISSMFLGEQLGSMLYFPSTYKLFPSHEIPKHFKGNWLFCIISIVSLILYSREMLGAAGFAGYEIGSDKLLKYVRWGTHSVDYSHNILVTFLFYITVGIGYVHLFIIINNIQVFRKIGSSKIRLFIPIICHIALIIISTSRADVIQYFYITIILWIISYQISHNRKPIPIRKAIKIGLSVIVLVYLSFTLLGILTGKTIFSKIWDTISIYTASSLPALEIWLRSSDISNNFQETFFGAIQLLNRFGANLKTTDLVKEFVVFNNGSITNVYSAIRHYYQDFGTPWVALIYFSKGIMFGYLLNRIRIRARYDLSVLIYAYLSYDIVRQITASEYLTAYFTIYHLLTFLSIIIVYLIINHRRNYLKITTKSYEDLSV